MAKLFRCSECGKTRIGTRIPSDCGACGKAGSMTDTGEVFTGGGFRHPHRGPLKTKVYPAKPKRRKDSIDLAGQLQQLTELWRSGALSNSEFENAKSRLIDGEKS